MRRKVGKKNDPGVMTSGVCVLVVSVYINCDDYALLYYYLKTCQSGSNGFSGTYSFLRMPGVGIVLPNREYVCIEMDSSVVNRADHR